MSYDNANDIVDELFKILLSRYQDNLETSMKGSDFVFDPVQLLYYKWPSRFLDVVIHILILQTE